VVLIEDAIHYRSVNHRLDGRSIKLYRWYYSRICQWGLNAGIFVILALAFIEKPSSLSVTSDLRFKHTLWNPPCGLTEVIEIICLLVFTLDLVVKSYLIGREEFLKCKWLVGYMVVIMVSVIDWTMSLSMTCDETVRIRKLLRPFYLLQNSSLMKKSLKCIKRTLPGITSVILLVILHLCLFTIFGMLLFAKREEDMERELYFKNLSQSLTSLLVLLTTANNPDVMTPAYTLHRGFSIFFILFSGFGTYFLMNLLTAIIYNQFRGYLVVSWENEEQIAVLHHNVGSFPNFIETYCFLDVSADIHPEKVTEYCSIMPKYVYQPSPQKACQSYSGRIPREAFQRLFDELDKDRIKKHHPLPEYSSKFLQMVQYIFTKHSVTVVGNVVALANVVCICIILVIECEKTVSEREDYLETVNCFFILYYLLEMLLKMTAFGWKTYVSYGSNIFDGSLTVLLLGLQISIFSTYRLPFSNPVHGGPIALWELVRLVNMLIVFRFLRIIPNIKLMALVASTLVDLVKNLRAFAGILVVVYYVFAILGVWLFKGAITAHSANLSTVNSRIKAVNKSLQCGSYEQLGYWSNNFDDFASALVLLYNIMMMNNWNVFLDAYSRYTTEWSKIYFIAWWLTSSVMWVNLFVALILENFIYKWDRNQGCSNGDMERTNLETTVQLMFRGQIEEPTEEEVVTKLHAHHHLQHLTMSVSVDQT
uniref:Ion transport domain-containing protein n=1 Tax=Esox lucius TaxID=8010 RepID=A0A6Q2XRX4_ESOLU